MPDPGFFVTHPGSRAQKGTGSRIRIRNTDIYTAFKGIPVRNLIFMNGSGDALNYPL
jgi:hypothetical protein